MIPLQHGAGPWAVYDCLLQAADSTERIHEVLIGLTWTLCRSAPGIGLAMSPGTATRTLPWPGTLVGQPMVEIAAWVRDWDPYRATVGMAALNAVLNVSSPLLKRALPIIPKGPANLAVFEYFADRLSGQKVVVVGRYPGLESYTRKLDITVLERQPGGADLPDPASEYVLADADWVFMTATTLVNKTFPRLAELSRKATLVLMGPTVPWTEDLAVFGVDYLAGTQITNAEALRQTIAEGGGTRIFEQGLRYCMADLNASTTRRYG